MTAVKPGLYGNGVCPRCGRTVNLTKDGRLRVHKPHDRRPTWYGMSNCDGREPKEERA